MDANGGKDAKDGRDNKEKKENAGSKENKLNIPREQAVALKYDKNDGAPKVVAKGSGYLADRILGIAKTENIPVYEDEQLVVNLTKLDLGETIPPELFEIVAHIYAFVDKVDALIEDAGDVVDKANIKTKNKK